jgi:hypothetical protein
MQLTAIMSGTHSKRLDLLLPGLLLLTEATGCGQSAPEMALGPQNGRRYNYTKFNGSARNKSSLSHFSPASLRKFRDA